MIVKMLLDRKREGKELASEEITELINEYTRGNVPDYQLSAFAMAVCCRGMTERETLALTLAMRDSGRTLNWEGFAPSADKHSTGGVGDKLSFLIQPIAAACGLAVPSLTGRGLGLTGGTADKLESIPGYNAGLSLERFREVVRTVGCSLTVQTAEIAPADKKLYALRDVTGTVPSIPLIVASILSKKLAEGAGSLVFDVKCGEGAFMKTRAEADELARQLVAVARGAGRKAAAIVTDMNQPLGRMVGNALEVAEADELLAGQTCEAQLTLSLEFAAQMVAMAKDMDIEVARVKAREAWLSGAAHKVWRAMVAAHGGDWAAFERRDKGVATPVMAPMAGRVKYVSATKIAQAALLLGAGRQTTADTIDPAAGVEICAPAGTAVTPGTPLARAYHSPNRQTAEALKLIQTAFEIEV